MHTVKKIIKFSDICVPFYPQKQNALEQWFMNKAGNSKEPQSVFKQSSKFLSLMQTYCLLINGLYWVKLSCFKMEELKLIIDI